MKHGLFTHIHHENKENLCYQHSWCVLKLNWINTEDLSKRFSTFWDKGKSETHSFKLRSVNKADVIKTWSEYTFNVLAFISTNRHAMHRELSDNCRPCVGFETSLILFVMSAETLCKDKNACSDCKITNEKHSGLDITVHDGTAFYLKRRKYQRFSKSHFL